MPTRTELPTISMTWMTTSSPSMIFSPGFLVMMSTVRSSLEVTGWLGRGDGGGLGEQRGADGGVRRLVDHLVAAAVRDHDRRAEVAAEVRELLGGPNGDPQVDRGGVARADPLGVGVGQLDRVVAEVLPRVGDRQGD